jgi:hypothetical protein
MEQELIFAGAELEKIYSHPNTLNANYIFNSTNPVIIFCNSPESHLSILRKILMDENDSLELKTKFWKPKSEIFPEMCAIMDKDTIIALFIQEQYCHAYNTVSVKGRKMKILALDTAISLFYALSYIDDLNGIVPNSMQHFADTLVHISMNTRDKGVPSKFPLFVITCEGHQPSKASLLEAKAQRLANIKSKGKGTRKNSQAIMTPKSLKTRKIKPKKKGY